MPEFRIFIVDAFSSTPLKGNAAAVCILNRSDELSDDVMLKIASEFNQSETAFVAPKEGTNDYTLRWFTPKVEVPLCGHATLATTHVLLHELTYDVVNVSLETMTEGEVTICHNVSKTLYGGKINFSDLFYAPKAKKLIVPLAEKLTINELSTMQLCTGSALQACDPNGSTVKGVCVTCASGDARKDIDFLSRYFAPWVGINEDTVTGSLHCALAPYWFQRIRKAIARGYQCYPGGGGEVTVHMHTDTDGCDKVKLIGEAVTIVRGTLVI